MENIGFFNISPNFYPLELFHIFKFFGNGAVLSRSTRHTVDPEILQSSRRSNLSGLSRTDVDNCKHHLDIGVPIYI